MYIWAMFFDTAGRNLLLGFVPESLGLLIFGALLIGFAASLRRFLKRGDEMKDLKENAFSAQAGKISEKV